MEQSNSYQRMLPNQSQPPLSQPFASAVASIPHQGPPIVLSKFLDNRKS